MSAMIKYRVKILRLVNKAVAAFRQDHGWGIMIHVTSQRVEDGLRVVIRKTPRTSVSGGRPAARL